MLGRRIAAKDYGKYFDDAAEDVFMSLTSAYGITKEFALGVMRSRKAQFVELLSSTHKVKIPEFVAYMKLRGFVNNIRKELYEHSQPYLGNSTISCKYIGFSGAMGSGKSLSATYLKEILQEQLIASTITGFANPLKELMCSSFGFTHDQLYTQDGKAAFNPTWGMTNRECLQKLGTEALRNNFHPDVWVKLAELNTKNNNILTIFDDVRFPNEADFISNSGFLVRIDRPGTVSSAHESEQPLSVADYVINNDGTMNDLRVNIYKMVEVFTKVCALGQPLGK